MIPFNAVLLLADRARGVFRLVASRPMTRLMGLALLGGLAACGGEAVTPIEPVEDPTQLYWSLTLNQHAITLAVTAPYDTFRLAVTPHRLDGTPIAGLAAPTYTSADPDRVQVGPDGLVRALAPAQRVRIVASVVDESTDIIHSDTALVTVTSAPPASVPARLVLEPNPPDSAKGTMFPGLAPYYPTPAIVPRFLDAADTELAGLAVWIESSAPLVGHYDNVARKLTPYAFGPVTFVATAWAYGVALADTLDYTIGLPLGMFVQVREETALDGGVTYHFNPATLVVGVGAYLWWFHSPQMPRYDVTFDDPTHVAADAAFGAFIGKCAPGNTAGNILLFGDTTTTSICTRYFPVAGTYHYHSEALGRSGTIIVVDESTGEIPTWAIDAYPKESTGWAALLPAGTAARLQSLLPRMTE